ncbi:MAG: DUF1822 family protein [Cyanobacteria bacterium]|nr:DUF1822 family protein [Cyanobacteriota bacterium]MDW8201089.1 DUF1822 family protein [Cyanobacteriota bacterium SKYGB_h_bin112]
MSYATLEYPPLPIIPPDPIPLTQTDIQQAIQLSDAVLGEECQWQTYLQGLALMGFTTWLRERSPHLSVQLEHCSLWQPEVATVIPAACKLIVGDFSLCLLATEHLWHELVNIPRAVLELPTFTAHFYVVIEVQEEEEQVVIQGFARFDQLDAYRRSHTLSPHPDWSYSLPLHWFDPEPNHLLTYLQVLDPAAIILPESAMDTSADQTLDHPIDVYQLLAGLKSSNCPLWQQLSWEQGQRVLQNLELLRLCYQWQQAPNTEDSPNVRLLELLTLALQRVVRLGRWLQGELDDMANQLGLFLLPTTAMVAPMLSLDRFEAAIAELRNQSMDIPPQPTRAYQDLDWQDVPLRLCILTWRVSENAALDDQARFSVLFILGMQTNATLPDGLKLRVSNAIGVLHEPIAEFDDPFLFARVQGQLGDTFVVTICHINCPPLTLAPYQLTLA